MRQVRLQQGAFVAGLLVLFVLSATTIAVSGAELRTFADLEIGETAPASPDDFCYAERMTETGLERWSALEIEGEIIEELDESALAATVYRTAEGAYAQVLAPDNTANAHQAVYAINMFLLQIEGDCLNPDSALPVGFGVEGLSIVQENGRPVDFEYSSQ